MLKHPRVRRLYTHVWRTCVVGILRIVTFRVDSYQESHIAGVYGNKARKKCGHDRGTKKRGARQLHKRLFYRFNVNRTSLDHLLLGKNADVDKNVECLHYIAG